MFWQQRRRHPGLVRNIAGDESSATTVGDREGDGQGSATRQRGIPEHLARIRCGLCAGRRCRGKHRLRHLRKAAATRPALLGAFDGSTGIVGGSSFTLGIAHREGDVVVLDAVRERKPRFIVRDVIAEYAELLKSYGVYEVAGDQFAFELFAAEWTRVGIRAVKADFDTSGNYQRLLPLLLARRARLINNATLRTQLVSLERRVSPTTDRETICKPQYFRRPRRRRDVRCRRAGARWRQTYIFWCRRRLDRRRLTSTRRHQTVRTKLTRS